MSLYVARSPYRSSYSRSGLSSGLGGFAKLGSLFKKRDSRIDRSGSVFSLKGLRKLRRQRKTVSFVRGVNMRPRMNMSGGFDSYFGLAGGLKRGGGMGIKALIESVRKFKDVKSRYVFGPSTIIVGMVVIAVSMSLVYLAHFNQVATKGYDLKRLQADQNQLMSQYEIKNMRLAEIKALNAIAHSEKVGKMRRPSNVMFVSGNTALASR